MARFMLGEEQNYGGNGGSGFFSIANDGEVKKVRFLYDKIEDVEGYAVHEVEVNGKKRYVNCLRNYDSPIDDCPFCKAGRVQTVKMFIPLYDETDGKVKFWERGKKFFSRMSGLCARYPSLVSQPCEIERHGAKGSKDTTYEIFPVGSADTTKVSDLVEERPKVLGGIVLDKNASDMKYYLEHGSFPDGEKSKDEPVRRTPRSDSF